MLHSYLPKCCKLIYRNTAFLFTENLHCYLPITEEGNQHNFELTKSKNLIWMY